MSKILKAMQQTKQDMKGNNMKEKALKLANELELIAGMIAIGDRIKWGQDSELMENGSTMIRRLVEELDKLNGCLIAEQEHNEMLVEELDYLKDQISFYEIKNLDSGIIGKIGDSPIHDLVHRTAPQIKKSKPVVYWDGKHFASKEKSSLADIPLYTAPQTKPLSDEEIENIYWSSASVGYDGCFSFKDFARAIEKEHGIK